MLGPRNIAASRISFSMIPASVSREGRDRVRPGLDLCEDSVVSNSEGMRFEKPSGFEFRVRLHRDPAAADRHVIQLAVRVVALQRGRERAGLIREQARAVAGVRGS